MRLTVTLFGASEHTFGMRAFALQHPLAPSPLSLLIGSQLSQDGLGEPLTVISSRYGIPVSANLPLHDIADEQMA